MCNGENHIFYYSDSDTLNGVPEGTPCECGMVIAKYEYCQHCGSRILKTVPNPDLPRNDQYPDFIIDFPDFIIDREEARKCVKDAEIIGRKLADVCNKVLIDAILEVTGTRDNFPKENYI